MSSMMSSSGLRYLVEQAAFSELSFLDQQFADQIESTER